MGFDFAGTYTRIIPHQRIEATFGGRALTVEFLEESDGVIVRESFDAETTHSEDMQRAGWLAGWLASHFGEFCSACGPTSGCLNHLC